MTIARAIADSRARLGEVSDSARLDAELLVARAIDMPRSYLFAHPDDVLDNGAVERLQATVARRQSGEPLAYITGTKEFWSLELMVTPATLVPRPETEKLVEIALRIIPLDAEWDILDLGTGSGAIAIAIAHERPHCQVSAIDVCPEAIAVAEQNVRQLQLANVRCIQGDWTAPVAQQSFQVILSNPPYVRTGDPALKSLSAEPGLALLAGDDGLAAISRLATDCRPIIDAEGCLILEHGNEQREAVADLLNTAGWRDIECHRDYAGHDRVTVARPAVGQS